MVRTAEGSALRGSTTDVLAEYLAGQRVDNTRRLSPAEELEEAWFLGLRLRAGVSWHSLAAEFGPEPVAVFASTVRELCDLGLLLQEEDTVRLTPRGVLFSNEVFERFLGVAETAPPVIRA